MSKIDLSDIARGRRITAVTASELDMVPRKAERPQRAVRLKVLIKRMQRLFRAA